MSTTLTVHSVIGDALLGHATLGVRHPSTEIGRPTPLLRKPEDALGLLHYTSLDPGHPIEVNTLQAGEMLARMARYPALIGEDYQILNPHSVFDQRPVVAGILPELFTRPHPDGLAKMASRGGALAKLAQMRHDGQGGIVPDGEFWSKVAQNKLLGAVLAEEKGIVDRVKASLYYGPVPVIHGRLSASPTLNAQVNRALANRWHTLNRSSTNDVGYLYTLPVHTSALGSKNLLNATCSAVESFFAAGDARAYGVFLSFVDVGQVKGPRMGAAKDLVKRLAKIARQNGRFLWVSDVGALAPIFLDGGASFASFHPGITARRAYSGGGGSTKDLQCGAVLPLWKYDTHRRSALAKLDWKVDTTGLFDATVPEQLRDAAPVHFRVRFGKPSNIATLMALGNQRLSDLAAGSSTRPGEEHVRNHSSSDFAQWAS